MTSLTWLHLTDFHCGEGDQNWLWPNVQADFFQDLDWLYRRCGAWDLVLFTGDLTQKGQAHEFDKLDTFLNDVWRYFEEKLGINPKLLVVPGNHDLVRPAANNYTVPRLQNWQIDQVTRNEFWDDETSSTRQIVNNAFINYTNWSANCQYIPKDLSPGLLPGDFSFAFCKNNVSLGILGLNTSFLQLTSGAYRGNLALNTRQFHEACNGNGPAWAQEHQACLLLTHHPPDWLDKESQDRHLPEIYQNGRFKAHLCGHLHEAAAESVSRNFSTPRLTLQGRSLFGLEHYETSTSTPQGRLHGYSVGRIELYGKKEILRFWPRESRIQGNQRKFVPDYSFNLKDYFPHTELGSGSSASPVKTYPELMHELSEIYDELKDWKKLHEELQKLCFKWVLLRGNIEGWGTEYESIIDSIDSHWNRYRALVTKISDLALVHNSFVTRKIQEKDRTSDWIQRSKTSVVEIEEIIAALMQLDVDESNSDLLNEIQYKIRQFLYALQSLEQTSNEFLIFVDKSLQETIERLGLLIKKMN